MYTINLIIDIGMIILLVVTIFLGQINKPEIELSYKELLFEDLKPSYVNDVRIIKFIDYNYRYYGKTNQYGDIELNLTGSLYSDKITLCHELLHTILWSNNVTFDEWFIEDLSRQFVCYK